MTKKTYLFGTENETNKSRSVCPIVVRMTQNPVYFYLIHFITAIKNGLKISTSDSTLPTTNQFYRANKNGSERVFDCCYSNDSHEKITLKRRCKLGPI